MRFWLDDIVLSPELENLELSQLNFRISPSLIPRGARPFRLNRSFDARTSPSERVLAVHKAFGLGIGKREYVIYRNLMLDIDPGDVVYITGESGGGKSLILRDLETQLRKHNDFKPVLNFSTIEVNPKERAIEGVGKDVAEAIEILSAVGLGEAYLFLRRYSELSDGQKFRYRMAKALSRNPKTLVIDEFCSNLDRATAKVLAFLTQKWCRRRGITLVVATAHDDLIEDLGPDVLVVKRFGSSTEVRYDLPRPERCSLMKSLRIEKGSMADYRALAEFHYRGGTPPMLKAIYKAMIGPECAGVIVYTRPLPVLKPRYDFFPFLRAIKKESTRKYLYWVNEHFARISRVIVHPKFRGIGVAVELVRQTLPLEGKPYVETLAVMAKFNPFFEKAGMIRLANQIDPKVKEALESTYAVLRKMGAEEHVLLDPELFKQWYKGLGKAEKERAQKALHVVFEISPKWHWHRSKPKLEDLAATLVKMLNPPEYLVWKNPSPEYADFPDPVGAVPKNTSDSTK